MKITKLSPFGFKVDDGDVWFSCDKYFLNSNLFKSLKVGMSISDIVNNKQGFVKSITVLHHKDQGEEVNSSTNFTSLKSTLTTLNSINTPSLPASLSLGSDILERDKGLVLDTSSSKSLSVQESIRYAQCVNIAFWSLSTRDLSLEASCNIMKGFNIADEIFKEFNKRCSR